MDPKAALDIAEYHVHYLSQGLCSDEEEREETKDEATCSLEDYLGWRKNGGFEPENGDERCAALQSRLESL